MRVLLVEDEPIIAITLSDDLTAAGCAVERCDEGRRALSALDHQPFDCVISDLRLPGADGLSVLRAARRSHPDALAILISAHAAREQLEACQGLGARFVPKPFHNEQILALLAGHQPCRGAPSRPRDGHEAAPVMALRNLGTTAPLCMDSAQRDRSNYIATPTSHIRHNCR